MAQTEQVTVEVQAHIDNYVNNMKRATAFMKSAATVQGKAVNSMNQILGSNTTMYEKSGTASNQYAQAVQNTSDAIDKNSRMYQQAEYRLDGMTRQTLNAEKASGGFGNGMKSMGNSLQSVGGYISQAGNALTNFVPGLKNVGIVAGATAVATTKAFDLIGSVASRTVSRLDILSTAPKVWQAMGASAGESSQAINYLARNLDGLNAPLEDAVDATSRFMTVIGQNNDVSKRGVTYASQLAKSWTVAGLASGKSAAVVKSGMTQFIQLLGNATAAGQEFNTLRELMPAQLEDLSEHMLGAGKSSRDLQQALKDGTVTTQDLEDAFIELSGADGKWAKLAQENSLTVGAQWENMQSKFANLFAAIITGTTDPNMQGQYWSENVAANMKKIADAIRDLTPKIVEFTQGFKEGFGEAFGKAVERLKGLIEPFTIVSEKLAMISGDDLRDKGKATGELVVQFIQLALAIQAFGTVVSIIGTVTKAIGMLSDGFALLRDGIMGGEAGGGLIGIITDLGGAIGALSTPVLIITGLVAALAGAFTIWATQTQAGKDFINDAWKQIQDAVSDAGDKLQSIWGDLKQTFGELGDSIVDGLNAMGFNFQDFQSVVDAVMQAVGQTVTSIITNIIEQFGNMAQMISGAIQIVVGAIQLVMGIFEMMRGVVDVVMGAVTGDTDRMGRGFDEFKTGGETAVKGVKRVFSGLGDFFDGILNAIISPISSMINWFAKLGQSADSAKSKANSASHTSSGSRSRSASPMAFVSPMMSMLSLPEPVYAEDPSMFDFVSPMMNLLAMPEPAYAEDPALTQSALMGGFGNLNSSITSAITSVGNATNTLPNLRRMQAMESYDSNVPSATQSVQPAEFVLKMGTETFRGFANDISGSQGQSLKLKKSI